MATAVVCDDDDGLRAVISALCEEQGIQVVAETDSATDAAELVQRFDIDLLVLDLSLEEGSGVATLHYLRDADVRPTIVVFSAYADDPIHLRSLGATEVVEKPDFDRLTEVLAEFAEARRAAPADERRYASRSVDEPPGLWRSPSGVSSNKDLNHSVQTLVVGDAVLGVALVGLDALERDVGPNLTADCRLTVGRLLHTTLRVQDLLHEGPEHTGFIALLRGGDARSVHAVWARLTRAVEREDVPGLVRGVGARVDPLGPTDAIARVVGSLLAVESNSPPFQSV